MASTSIRTFATAVSVACVAGVVLIGCSSPNQPAAIDSPDAASSQAESPADTETTEAREVLETSDAPAAIGPYSQGISAGGVVYVSGQLPINPAVGEINPDQTTAEQTDISLRNVAAVLKAAELDLSDVASVTVYLSDMDDFKEFNKVYEEHFGTDGAPARATVEVARLPLDAKVEISAVAVR